MANPFRQSRTSGLPHYEKGGTLNGQNTGSEAVNALPPVVESSPPEGWGREDTYDPISGLNVYGRTPEGSRAALIANQEHFATVNQAGPQTSPISTTATPDYGEMNRPNVVGGLFTGAFPVGDTTTQADLRAAAVRAQPPAVRDLLTGRRPHHFEPGAMTGQRLFSPQQLARLTPDEQSALRSRLAVENLSLDDFLFAQRHRFGNPRQAARGRLTFR